MRYVESDTALVNRVLGREVGGKQNILVFNDEAHHAYRIRQDEPDEQRRTTSRRGGGGRGVLPGGDGLGRRARPDPQAPRHQLLRRPLGHAVLPRAGRAGDEPAVPVGRQRLRPDRRHRVGAGEDPAARGPRHDRRGDPGLLQHLALDLAQADPGRARRQAGQPEARGDPEVGAHADRACSAGCGRKSARNGQQSRRRPRPPVFILVCKNTRSPRWSTSGWPRTRRPTGIPPAKIEGFRNRDGHVNTIRVDSKVVHETDTGEAKSDETALDAVHARHGRQAATGRRTGRAGRSTRKGSRNWRRSWTGRCTRRAATCAASSASAC